MANRISISNLTRAQEYEILPAQPPVSPPWYRVALPLPSRPSPLRRPLPGEDHETPTLRRPPLNEEEWYSQYWEARAALTTTLRSLHHLSALNPTMFRSCPSQEPDTGQPPDRWEEDLVTYISHQVQQRHGRIRPTPPQDPPASGVFSAWGSRSSPRHGRTASLMSEKGEAQATILSGKRSEEREDSLGEDAPSDSSLASSTLFLQPDQSKAN